MIELKHLLKSNGVLTKRIHLTDTGMIVSDGSAYITSSGRARQMRVNTLGEFSNLIQDPTGEGVIEPDGRASPAGDGDDGPGGTTPAALRRLRAPRLERRERPA